MPSDTIYVGRPTIYGNPYRAARAKCCNEWDVTDENDMWYIVDHEYVHNHQIKGALSEIQAKEESVRLYFDELTGLFGDRVKNDQWFGKQVKLLDQPCHADVLLELANQES